MAHIFGNAKLSDASIKQMIQSTLELTAVRTTERVVRRMRNRILAVENALLAICEREGVSIQKYQDTVKEIVEEMKEKKP